MTLSSLDLQAGVAILSDGQRVPITKYFGNPDLAPEDGQEVDGFDWVTQVVAGPDADGNWFTIEVTDDDRATPDHATGKE